MESIGSQPNSYFEYQKLDINSFLCRRSTIAQMDGFLPPHFYIPHRKEPVAYKIEIVTVTSSS